MQSLNSFDSSKPYGRLLENQKKGALKNYFCLKITFKIAPQKFFQKKHSDFGGLETNRKHEIQT